LASLWSRGAVARMSARPAVSPRAAVPGLPAVGHWERLLVNVGIVLVFAAFYLRFLKGS